MAVVDGNLEWMAKVALLATAEGYARLVAITSLIRKARDTSTPRDIKDGAIDIDILFDKPLDGDVVEYHGVIEFGCEIYKAEDTTGEVMGNLVGGVRDLLNTTEYDGGAPTPAKTFLTALNAQAVAGPMVFHDVREGQLLDESHDKLMRKVVQADCWVYPGTA